MKKLLFLLTLSLCSLVSALSSAYAQTIPPPYINYQAVLYDVNGANPNNPLINQSFTTFVNINDELGNLLYREEHYASTDTYGICLNLKHKFWSKAAKIKYLKLKLMENS